MALFSRREIQARIDEAARFLTPVQLAPIIGRLNKPNRTAIEAEWELMWLTSLARVGAVQHEPKLPSATRYPDIYFQADSLAFVADIAAVSNAGYEKENPIKELRAELNKLYRKHSPTGGFSLHLQSQMEGAYGDRRVKLALPPRGKAASFVKENFEPFVRIVAKNQDTATSHRVTIQHGFVQLDYDPKRRPGNFWGSHLSFDVPYSLNRNPVFNVLKSKKRQLAKVGFNGTNGVLLCDGDCSMLCTSWRTGTAYTLSNIVQDFLRQNSSIAFVLTIGVATQHSLAGRASTQLSFKPQLYVQRGISASQQQSLETVLGTALNHFPNPYRTPQNAIHYLKVGSPPRVLDRFNFTIGDSMKPSEIKFSARTLTSLLAGTINLKEFRETHRMHSNIGSASLEPLRLMVEQGRKLESIALEPQPGEDDDYVVLKFGPTDPAAVKFRLPDKA
jgi:hypothetical protein